MKKLSILLLIGLLTNFCYSQEQSSMNIEESKETFIVTINNEEYLLSEGEALKIDSMTLSVKLADYKVFQNESISFNYPNNFSFEYEEDIGYKNWTFDGNDYVIMYFELDTNPELDDFVNEMVNQFGKEKCVVEKSQLSIGNKSLNGKRINVTLLGHKMVIDFLEIKMSDSISRFIAFQDSRNEDGSPSSESLNTFKMIDETMKYK